jgi:hypothetical protein
MASNATKRTDKERVEQVMSLTRQLLGIDETPYSDILRKNVTRESPIYKKFTEYANVFIKEAKGQTIELDDIPGYKFTIILSTSRYVPCSIRIHRKRGH